MSIYWNVAVDAPLPRPLTYLIPPDLQQDARLQAGQSVLVPLGKRQAHGVLLTKVPAPENSKFKLKEITQFVDTRTKLSSTQIKWLDWLSSYYLYPIGQVYDLSFPPLEKQLKERISKKAPVIKVTEAKPAPVHTPEQKKVIEDIAKFKDFSAHLIFGVTGSGKTEIYISLLEKVIAEGKQCIVLVPEISLTPQLIDRFSARLGNHIAAIHSHLTPREKTNQWWQMKENNKQILIGARSALFCPLDQLGLIVVDEEHESSFKQDEKLKYHARDAAVMLAKFSNCPVILGSATPSLESWNNVLTNRYQLHELKNRVANRALPTIEVIDLKTERDQEKQKGTPTDRPFWMSERMQVVLNETFDQKKQSALFLNRRGMAQSVICPTCGAGTECPNCAVSLTLHGRNHLICHYCDYRENLHQLCKKCHQGEPKPLGLGTELIERDIQKLFPSARVLRMDRDEINTREELEEAISSIEFGDVDFVVGTQMIAKGLDFPRLIHVAIVMADVAFNLPDFRASERSFQLLTQVSGRSGRHVNDGSGKVLVQTYNPDHPSIQFAQAHDFVGFSNYELEFRKALSYPPYGKLSVLRITGLDLANTEKECEKIKNYAHALKKSSRSYDEIEILGPAPAPLQKIRNKYRFQMLLKGPDSQKLGAFCQQFLSSYKLSSTRLSLSLDVDAVNLL
jgi:primosomal protein N' (replication factor Y)